MKTKTKVILLVFLVLVIVLNSFKRVNAHSVDLDPEFLISMPMFIYGGSGTISISSSVTDYTLYFQTIKVETSAFSQMQTIKNNGEEELETLKEAYTTLKTEMNNLKEVYNTASTAYTNGLENTSLSEEEKEELRTAYETAKTNYQNKVTEYNNKIDEYNNKVNTINSQIKELVPMYVENNWIKTTDNKISVDTSKFSGEQSYAVWAKLVTSSGTYYDEAIYTMNGTKTTEIDITGVSLDKSTLSITEGSSYTLTVTIKPSDATNKSLIWTSDNEEVAKVENGKVIGISEGSATITVTTKNGDFSATCKVTVNPKEVTPETTDDNKQNSPNEENTKVDDTIVKIDKIPQAGTSNVVIIFIVVISVIGIVFYKKNKYLNLK